MRLDSFVQDVTFGLRMLRRSPGFMLVAVLTLSLGIGANTAIFTAANDFLLRPLPFSNSDRVVMVKQYDLKLLQSGWTDPPSFKYWRDQNSVFEEMAAWSETTHQFNLTGAEGPERVTAKQVSAAFFRVLGVSPVLGRTFSEAEARPGGGHVTLISHSLWQTRYGGSRAILGKTIILDGQDYIVVGVLPPAFRFSTTPDDVWVPLTIAFDEGRGGYYLNAIALLKSGVTLAQAQANMATLAAQLAKQFPDWNHDQRIAVEGLRDRYAREVRPALLTLLVAATFILLIACANTANLLLARAASRHREITIRRALGGHRTRIIRQLLTESSLLALLSGAAGWLIAFATVRIFYAALPAAWQPLTRSGMDASVLAFAFATSLLSVLLFGTAPAWDVTGFDLNESLKEGSQNLLGGPGSRFLRTMLGAGEIAIAMTLLIGAGLLVKSFARLSAVHMGFESENLLTFNISRKAEKAGAFYQEALDRISILPGIRAAGAINIPPLSGSGWSQDITIENRPSRPAGDRIWAAHREVSLGYFRAMGIPLVKGRSFVATDRDKPIAVISQTMARRYWPIEDPIGKRFGVNCSDSPCEWNSIVGIVADVREIGPTADAATAMYFLAWTNDMTLVVRSDRGSPSLIADVRGMIRSVDPDQPISEIRTMESIVSESVAPQHITMLVAGLFAALALALASVGIYGVISYSVVERTHEFGIRMTLGADEKDILRLVVGQGFKVVVLGVGVGILVAIALTRFVSSLLYGVKPTDPMTFVLVSLILTTIALMASYVPARRAMRVDPSVAMRHE